MTGLLRNRGGEGRPRFSRRFPVLRPRDGPWRRGILAMRPENTPSGAAQRENRGSWRNILTMKPLPSPWRISPRRTQNARGSEKERPRHLMMTGPYDGPGGRRIGRRAERITSRTPHAAPTRTPDTRMSRAPQCRAHRTHPWRHFAAAEFSLSRSRISASISS